MSSQIQTAFDSAEGVGAVGSQIRDSLERLCSLIQEATQTGEIPVMVGPQLESKVFDLAQSVAIELVGEPTPPPAEPVAESPLASDEAAPILEPVSESTSAPVEVVAEDSPTLEPESEPTPPPAEPVAE